jgi:hypothetical protein
MTTRSPNERRMRRFKSAAQVQRFASVHGLVRISSRWADICFGRLTTVCCEGTHSGSGMRGRGVAERARASHLEGSDALTSST